MNDALDHGEHMRDETVTMSRDEYEAAIRAAKVDALREAAADYWNDISAHRYADVRDWLRARADELEGDVSDQKSTLNPDKASDLGGDQ